MNFIMNNVCIVPKIDKIRVCTIHKRMEKSTICEYCNSTISDETKNVTDYWDENVCTKAQSLDANGTLKFESWPSISTAKYVKFLHSTIRSDIIKFISDHWKLEKPSLIVSVTGGEKNFNLPTVLRKAFKIGLIKVAKSTGAWIITTGINTGVTRLVGEAVSESTKKDNLVVMGITKWNNLGRREQLEFNYNGIIQYNTLKDIEYKCRLDPNHSHFIFFEDNITEKSDNEIAYRSSLEYSLMIKTQAVMVLIVVQGGIRAFKTVEQALRNGVTVLCLQNSGECADIIIKTCSKNKEWTDEMLKSLVYKECKKHCDEIYTCLKSIIELWKQNKSLVSVFSVYYEEDIELAILRGFINSRKEKLYENFELALKWNHYEIARTSLIKSDMNISKLESLFELALIYDRYEFVEILLENGVQLEDFLTKDRWRKLFNLEHKIRETDCVIWRILAKQKIYYDTVDENILKKVVQLLTFEDLEIEYLNSGTYAAQNLFLWALLFNRTNVAKLLWKNGKYHIMNALFASKLLKSMKGFYRDKSEALMREAEEFEDFAIDILNTIDAETHDIVNNCLLLRKVPIYNVDCLKMALNCDCKRFVLQPSIQVLLSDIWNWNITIKQIYRSFFMKTLVFITTVLSLGMLTPFFMEISKNQLEGIEHNPINQQFLDGSRFVDSNKTIMDTIIYQSKIKEEQARLPNRKLLFSYTTEFFKRPKTIFVYDVVLHLIFLLLFSYMMLCEFHYYDIDENKNIILAKYSNELVISVIVDLWVLGLFIEEIRQFVASMKSYYVKDAKKQNFFNYFRFCLNCYINDDWNIIDFFGCLIFFVGEIMRLVATFSTDTSNYLDYEGLYIAARIILSIDLLIWYSRTLFFCLASETLGPKLEIIRNLMKDLLFFVIIIGVISCAFAVVTEATMFPMPSFNGNIIKGMIRNAFWPIFGEFRMYDIILDADECQTNGEVCPDNVGLIFSFALLLCYPFVTLLLINLLIAMFNSTFDAIHNQTQLIWRYQRYYLIFSYCKYPFMLAPLSLVGDTVIFIFNCFIWIKRKFFGYVDDKATPIDQEMENILVLYEYRCTTEVYQKKEKSSKYLHSLTKRNEEQDKRIISLENQLKRIHEDILEQRRLKTVKQ